MGVGEEDRGGEREREREARPEVWPEGARSARPERGDSRCTGGMGTGNRQG